MSNEWSKMEGCGINKMWRSKIENMKVCKYADEEVALTVTEKR